MTKLLLVLSLFTLISSCNNSHPQQQEAQNGSTTPILHQDAAASAASVAFNSNVQFFNFDTSDEDKVNSALAMIKKVVLSPEFKARVLNFAYNGKKEFVDNGGHTNEQIYQKLLDGNEDLKPDIDHTMDLELEIYYSRSKTVGYTYPDGLRIWMNRKYFDKFTTVEVAGNIFHEWTHKLGFDHAFRYSPSRDYSVPYGLGYLMEELGKQYQ
jgi:hypothetical protein